MMLQLAIETVPSDTNQSISKPAAHPRRLKATPYLVGSTCYLLGSCLFLVAGVGYQGDLGGSDTTRLWGDLYTAGNLLFVIGSVLFVLDGYRAATR